MVDETIYFPKKYNDEQIEIIEKARRNNKVLVQGPPGTGKSHTIANLICHLLANGKKVLVTAYTKRALEVLKNQLPKDFQNLTVNLLSGDSASIQDLDASVNAINEELSGIISLNTHKTFIGEKEIELSLVKEQKASTKNEWLKVKEKATRRQNINHNYQGTLLEIAERIEKEHFDFSWFKDEFIDISKIHLVKDIESFISLTKYYQSVDCTDFDFINPQKEKLLSLVDFREYRKIVNELFQLYVSREEHDMIKCKDFPELKRQLNILYKLFLEIESSTSPFKSKLISEYRKNLKIWKDKIERSNNLFAELPFDKLKQLDRSVAIKYPNDKSLIELKNDANVLLSYLDDGNSLSGVLFNLKKALLPKNIKEKLYFIEEVQVNGSPCDTSTELQTVLDDIKTKQDFEEFESIWEIKTNANSKSYSDKAKYFKQLKEETELLIGLLNDVDKIKAVIETISSIRIHDYESNGIIYLIDETEYSFLQSQAKIFSEKIEESKKHLLTPEIHSIATTILKTFANIDPDQYEQNLAQIDTLNFEKEQYINYKKLQEDIQKHFPILVNEIFENTFDFSKIRQLENAILFKHAHTEIINLLAKDYETNLTVTISGLEKQEEKLISTIASKKAWLYVLESLSGNFLLRQHLQAWVQAVKKIGKTGTGKRALKFRKEAQHQMEKCKDSVPCWVMPLYKVAETINPKEGMYDYVIIDEASQLGADAIFLLYISKKIIIVGDDKQTSPEYVGVDANTMTPHINRHLQDIPFKNYYGTEFSFFDHAKRFCNGMTVLREHFRCMPEIIEFCNKNFYAPDGKGLYPLKQYNENRIDPLKAVFCQNGYVDGTYQNITNRIEAETIANKIAELIHDENYIGKTFGVIGLQGTKQATLIESLIIKKIGEVEFKKRDLVCGTSASFQGDERDIMFLSLITAHNHNRASLTKPEDERRFNVAVSRAKEQVWLVHSVQLEDLSNTNDLRYKLLDHFLNYKPQQIPTQRIYERTLGTQPDPFESWFEVDVYNDIVTNNYSVIPQYEVAKGRYRIDLVTLLSNGIKIAIECDGDKYHGPEQFQNDLMRQKVLERCGWQFFRVRGAEYYSNRKKALEPLWKLLRTNDIQKEQPNIHLQPPNNVKEEIKDNVIDPPITKTKVQTDSIINIEPDLFNEEYQSNISVKHEKQINLESIKISDDSNSNEILIFTSLNNVYKIQKRDITDRLQALDKIDFELDEQPIFMTGAKDYSGFLIVAFENGKIGKITMKSYHTEHNRKMLKNAFNHESKLIFIERIDQDIDLVILSSIKKVVLFNTNMINPVESKNTKGVQVMKQKDGSLMTKVERLEQVKLNSPEYYRKSDCLNVVGYYLKQGDEI